MTAVGMRMQRRRLPLGLLLRQTLPVLCGQVGEYYPLERRKEAISWRTLFPGVASVVKVIWFRFRISAARELPLNTRHGFAPIRLACITSRSVTATLSSTNPSVMGHSTRIAAVGSKCAAA